jgi:hypothetical protein
MHAFPSPHPFRGRPFEEGAQLPANTGDLSLPVADRQTTSPAKDLWARKVLQIGFAVRLQQFHDLHPHPSDGAGFTVDGPDPLRVLLIGAGLGVGYGVCVAGLALPGQLARLAALQLGRGVVVDNRTQPGQPLAKTISTLAPLRLRDYHTVVYLPAFTEVARRANHGWCSELDQLITALRGAGHGQPQIVLTGLPLPAGGGMLADASRSLAARQNAAMDRRAARHTLIHHVPMPPTTSLTRGPLFDAAYYHRSAERLAPLLRHNIHPMPLPRSA